MASAGLSVAVHASAVAMFGYSLYYNILFVNLPSEVAATGRFNSFSAWPGKWKYLTVWNLVLQLVYHTTSLLNDFVGSSELNIKRQTWFQKFRDSLFASWAFPTGVFVGVSFWVLFILDRELIFPKIMDSVFPEWLNHAIHTGPLVFVLLEAILVPHSHPSKLLTSAILFLGFGIYTGWIVWINYHSNVWAYPILEVLDNTQRGVFIGACAAVIFAFYFLGEALNSWRWGGKVEGKGHGAKGKAAGKTKRKTK